MVRGRGLHRSLIALLALTLCCVPVAGKAQEPKRVALLVANQSYAAEIGPLKNPHNDVRLVGTALAQVGFEVGTPVSDASREQILVAVHDFADRLKVAGPGAIGFLYYSGHGVAAGGDNVLVPVNIGGTTERELEISSVKLTEIVDLLNDRAPHAVHFVAIDACRSNLGGVRGSRGFVPVAERPGMFISFSAAPGSSGSDEGQDSGPYAAALAAEIAVPGNNHGQMFFEVRKRVAAATQQQQIPWTRDGLLRRVHFGDQGRPDPSSPAGLISLSPLSEAERVWRLTKESRDSAVLKAFIARYRDTFYAELARARLKAIEQESVTPAASMPPPPPPPPAPKSPASQPPASTRSPPAKKASTGNCRKETRDECRARLSGSGLRGTGACQYERRKTICE